MEILLIIAAVLSLAFASAGLALGLIDARRRIEALEREVRRIGRVQRTISDIVTREDNP
jgi:hypothetical protein